ncbi:MAG: cation:proton antiporter [Candidatus Verstraetearchaeota archaeon]|nr:cation:proton antiporter [Candidatus Verstraetearchaeota archaeon]
MIAPIIDLLLFFAITTPILGWLCEKIKRPYLCGIYVTIGLAIALWQVLLMKFPIKISQFSIDQLGGFMAITFLMLGIFASIFSMKYLERDTGIPLFYTLLILMIIGMIGAVFASDFFTFFVFWEMMCISSYTLVAFRKEKWEPIEASFKYLIMSSAGSASILFGMSLIYGMCGTLSFTEISRILTEPNIWVYIASIFIFIGLGIKSAIFPLHTWLPDAHSAAPSPISAMLSGVVVETGVYAICRIGFSIFSCIKWLEVIAILSIFTMFIGNLTPLLQTDIKRLLAYSTIAHIGYMLAGISTGTILGLTGALMHIFNHAIMKGLAFLCSGVILYQLETRDMREMLGVGRRMPITTTTLFISLFALAGMPPLNGFISELTIILASIEANMIWLGICIIINSIISAAYYLRVLKAFLQPITLENIKKVKEGPIIMLIPLILLAILIIIFGIWPDSLMNYAKNAAYELLRGVM